MLVLTRSIGERLIIGEEDEITVTVLDINGSQVRIGVDAPKRIPIHREEVHERIKASKGKINEKEEVNV